MFWTHIYDLLFKMVNLIISILILVQLPYQDYNPAFLIIGIMALFSIFYFFFLRTISSYFYSKFTLKMDLTFAQAKKLNGAFSPIFNYNFNWLHMKEIKNLDKDLKYETAVRIYEEWDLENKKKLKENLDYFKNSKVTAKARIVTMYLLIVFFGIASILDIAPASYITEWYCITFNTIKYYPMLNLIILCIPVILINKFLEKKLKIGAKSRYFGNNK